jgi:hypothetical protein
VGRIDLLGAGLRSSAIMLMGSGAKSIRLPVLLRAIKSVFEATTQARLHVREQVKEVEVSFPHMKPLLSKLRDSTHQSSCRTSDPKAIHCSKAVPYEAFCSLRNRDVCPGFRKPLMDADRKSNQIKRQVVDSTASINAALDALPATLECAPR